MAVTYCEYNNNNNNNNNNNKYNNVCACRKRVKKKPIPFVLFCFVCCVLRLIDVNKVWGMWSGIESSHTSIPGYEYIVFFLVLRGTIVNGTYGIRKYLTRGTIVNGTYGIRKNLYI